MKKSFILTTLLGLALSAGAVQARDISELIYGLDFDTLGGQGYTLDNLANNSATSGVTLTDIEATQGTAYRNYGTVTDYGGNGSTSGRLSGPAFKIGDQTSAIAGISGSEGFTLNFSYNMWDDWSNAIGFIYGGKKFAAQYGSSSFHVFADGNTLASGVGASGLTNTDNKTWYNVSISIKGDSLTMIVVDKDGNRSSSTSLLNGVDSSLGLTYVSAYGSGISQGVNSKGEAQSYERPAIDNSVDPPIPMGYIDDFSIWNGAFVEDDALLLAENYYTNAPMLQYAPEPSTATLSLLALAGLMIRRRRK